MAKKVKKPASKGKSLVNIHFTGGKGFHCGYMENGKYKEQTEFYQTEKEAVDALGTLGLTKK